VSKRGTKIPAGALYRSSGLSGEACATKRVEVPGENSTDRVDSTARASV
jgi:hypothetical protein